MSLAFNGSITLTSSTMTDGVVDPSNNQLYVVESTGPTMRKFNLQTLAQVGSNITCLATPGSICLINASSSVIASTGGTTVDFIENATGYRTNVTGGATLYGTNKGQRGASDTGNGVVFFIGSTANQIVKVTTAEVVTKPTFLGTTNFQPHCIIFKSSGRFLMGGKFGRIYEFDLSGNIMDELIVSVDPNTGLLANYNAAVLDFPTVNFMSYDSNILTVSTDESIMAYDYTTKTKIWEQQCNVSNAIDQIVLCAASSGETLISYNNVQNGSNVVKEFNFTTYGPALGDTLFTSTTQKIFCTGYAPGLSLGFALQTSTEKIHVVTVSATPTSLQTINLPAPYTNARLIVLDDTGGVGTIKRALDTYCITGNQYRLPTGKTLVGIIKMYNGTNAFWCESRVST